MKNFSNTLIIAGGIILIALIIISAMKFDNKAPIGEAISSLGSSCQGGNQTCSSGQICQALTGASKYACNSCRDTCTANQSNNKRCKGQYVEKCTYDAAIKSYIWAIETDCGYQKECSGTSCIAKSPSSSITLKAGANHFSLDSSGMSMYELIDQIKSKTGLKPEAITINRGNRGGRITCDYAGDSMFLPNDRIYVKLSASSPSIDLNVAGEACSPEIKICRGSTVAIGGTLGQTHTGLCGQSFEFCGLMDALFDKSVAPLITGATQWYKIYDYQKAKEYSYIGLCWTQVENGIFVRNEAPSQVVIGGPGHPTYMIFSGREGILKQDGSGNPTFIDQNLGDFCARTTTDSTAFTEAHRQLRHVYQGDCANVNAFTGKSNNCIDITPLSTS